MTVDKLRFHDRDSDEPPAWEYHGYYLTYGEPGYRLTARLYDYEPDTVRVDPLADPPREGFDTEVPYSDPRLARAAQQLLTATGATRIVLLGRGVDGASVELDLARFPVG